MSVLKAQTRPKKTMEFRRVRTKKRNLQHGTEPSAAQFQPQKIRSVWTQCLEFRCLWKTENSSMVTNFLRHNSKPKKINIVWLMFRISIFMETSKIAAWPLIFCGIILAPQNKTSFKKCTVRQHYQNMRFIIFADDRKRYGSSKLTEYWL